MKPTDDILQLSAADVPKIYCSEKGATCNRGRNNLTNK
jgi:hypothetical protein